jgi:hypothetical protein
MLCTVCGEDVGLLHQCRGVPAAMQTILQEGAPALRFAPLVYLRQAIAIARLEEKAILRNSRDNNALLYGAVFWIVALTPIMAAALRAQRLSPVLLVASLIVVMPITLLFQVAVWGVCHLAARFALQGRGSFLGITRVLLLGSIVQILMVIPIAGPLIGGIWAMAIMMYTFEAVHGIRRIHAFAISLIVGILIRAVGMI